MNKEKKIGVSRGEAKQRLRRLTVSAIFCAAAYILMFVLRIKVAGFLTFDAKDAVITTAAMLFGPSTGLIISFVVSTLELITVSDTGVYGWIMNFVSSAAFSVTAAWIYNKDRKYSTAYFGLFSGSLAMTVVMLVLNLLITPLYSGVSAVDVAKMIPGLLLPFNLTKALLNAGFVMVIYKPISVVLKKSKVSCGQLYDREEPIKEPQKYTFDKKTIAMLAAGLVTIIACIIVLIVIMNGDFMLIRKNLN